MILAVKTMTRTSFLCLKSGPDNMLTLDFADHVRVRKELFTFSTCIRQIDGEEHFQFVTVSGILRYYTLNRGERMWDPVI